MHRERNSGLEKAKDLKGSLKRLLLSLNEFKVLIIIAMVLAVFGAVLSIVSPKYLSKVVDEVSVSLVVNKENLKTIEDKMTNSFNEQNIKALQKKYCSEVNSIDCQSLVSFMETKDYTELSVNLINDIFIPYEIDGTLITTEDQIDLMKIAASLSNDNQKMSEELKNLPINVQKVLSTDVDLVKVKNLATVCFIMFMLSTVFEYFEGISMTIVSNNFARSLRERVVLKINKLPLKYFDKNQIGDVLSRITNDIDTVAQSMNNSLSTLVASVTLFIGSIIMMFATNWIMALTAIFASLFGFIFMGLVLSKSQKYFALRQGELGKLNAHIEEAYSGMNVIKAYNAEVVFEDKFDDLNNRVYKANFISQFLSGLMPPMMQFIGNLGYVAVCIVGAVLATKGVISFGTIIAFIMYVRLFTSPLSQIAQAMASMQQVAAASERVFEILDEEELSDESDKKIKLSKEDAKGNIEFKNVYFRYDGNEKDTITNFSLKAKKGEKIAIVGPTGAGKTNLVNLLMRFYEIKDGDIYIDGINAKDLTRDNIHELFTMVLQDTWLFEGTIKENIVYNMKDISDEEIHKVCKYVGVDHFIKTLPNGYDSYLTDNDSVSSGQRQLLTIARGMMENAPFLILDEATSNVDTRTEELVQKAMDKLSKNKTSFIIAHRLSTIKNADLILVMNEGNIVEQGTHEELLEKNGFYAKLYNAQFSEE